MALVTIGVTLPGSWLRWVARTQDMDSGSSGFGSRGGNELATWWVRRCVLATWADPRSLFPLGVLSLFRESRPRIFMDYVDFLISACMRHLPYFILREREREVVSELPPNVYRSTDRCKAPHYPTKKSKQSSSQPSRSSQCRMTRHIQLFLPLDQATVRRRSRRHQGRE